MCKILKKFTEGNTRKFTVNFAYICYADVIKYQEKPTILCERVQIITARIISARAVIKPIGKDLKVAYYSFSETQLHALRNSL